jgi:hypothetical protein
MTYTLNLYQKLTWKAYSVHLAASRLTPAAQGSWPRPSTAEALAPGGIKGDGAGQERSVRWSRQAMAAADGINLA